MASNKKILLGTLCVLAGVIYFILISFQIGTPRNSVDTNNNTSIFSTTINAKLSKTSYINIISGHAKPQAITLNNQPVNPSFPYPETRTSHRDAVLGDVYPLDLQRGENELRIITAGGQQQKISLSQQYSLVDFLLGFLALIPILYLLFNVGLRGFDAINAKLATKTVRRNFSLRHVPLMILFTGIALRLWYAFDMGYIQFQHDYHGHIEYLKFVAHEFFIPLPHKAWEFPQQPFYYIVNGALYAVLEGFAVPEDIILRVISFTTTVLTCIGLVYCYRLLKLLSDSVLIQSATLGFLCFIPSMLYMSSRINNDPWAFALSCIATFYIFSSCRAQWQKQLIPALLFTSLLFMTKVSALTIELLFFGLLVASYLQAPSQTRSALWQFCLVGTLLLGYTLFRGYYPATGAVHLVNSGIWPGQDLRPLTLSYFFSFNFAELYSHAQSSIVATDNHAITRSFPTYQYGTLFFGEFDYTYWRDRNSMLFPNMQLVLVLGLIIPLGWIAYCFRKKTVIDWLFIAITLVALALVLRFATSYPSVSNTDFRYYAPVYFFFAYCFACGIDTLTARSIIARRLVSIWLGLLFVSCVVFTLALIRT